MPAISMETMLEATRLTRAGRLMEATALLRGQEQPGSAPNVPPDSPFIDMVPPLDPGGSWSESGTAPSHQAPGPADAPQGMGSFKSHSFRGPEGQRAYKLYVPSGEADRRPLIVMLHGCTQSPDDFAIGTGMNRLADEHGMLVAYPAQSQSANAKKCWNWFQAKDQKRVGGEPAIIAAITRQIAGEHAFDPDRVYIAGLSAGGAAAAIMGEVYPDIFAAVGVHSGLARGAARDMPSAFTAMRAGGNDLPARSAGGDAHFVPTILFHGDRDATVHPVNGDQVLAQSRAAADRLSVRRTSGTTPAGLRYTVTVEETADGQPVLEHWLVHGAGHAWSGGHAAGSFTEPRGPDASREMVRFFLANPRPRASS
ncbi:MAG: PHB depolymerase family esterase [Phreatobacter sp.]|nr:PHB depolymerase family esterase [Phreatobacter sp.]